MNSLKEVTTVAGSGVTVDTSDKACDPFGFRSGQKVQSGNGKLCTVVGVGPMPIAAGCAGKGTDVLWLTLAERGDDKVCFFPNPSRDLTALD